MELSPRALVVAVVLAGCGRLGFEVSGDDGGDNGGNKFVGLSRAYIKASNAETEDVFAEAAALSADGTTLAIGAPEEDSGAIGIDGAQTDNSFFGSGAVYIFVRAGDTWVQQAYVKASNTGFGDLFGSDVALSADGNTLAVSAPLEESAATGVGGDQTSDATQSAGAAYVFVRLGTVWTQEAYVKASNPGAGDSYGHGLALSGDGATLAVGAMGESSSAAGIDGDETDNSAANSGAVYVYTRSPEWSQQAYVKSSLPRPSNVFGATIALSTTGDVMVVGSPGEDSNATGIDGDQSNVSASNSGAAYVFTRAGVVWSQDAYVKPSNTSMTGQFGGAAVTITGNGDMFAIGAHTERSGATGIDGDQSAPSGSASGAVYVFVRAGTNWIQQSYVKASNANPGDHFGVARLSTDGSALAVGAINEASAATGLDGDQLDDSAPEAGAVYLFARSGTSWRQDRYVKATNTEGGDLFGLQLAISGDGLSLAVGASNESSTANSINGLQSNNGALRSGAAYLYY